MPDDSSSAPRVVFANVVGITFGDNDVMCNFAIEMTVEEKKQIVSQATIAMTPKTAKILAQNLTAIIGAFENQTGKTIDAPAAPTLEELQAGIHVNPPQF